MKSFLTAFGMTLTIIILLNSCSISYQLNGASVDYNLVKTISISDFPNHTAFAPSLSATFSDALRNKYIRQTRLRLVDNNADLELEGEITGYNIKETAVRESSQASPPLASMSELSITVRVRYTNNKRPSDDLDQSFTAAQSFPNDVSIEEAQVQLIPKIIDDLVDLIYNATLGNW
ncbi:MAG: LPS assembly lipoprotein LptE [Dysgonamonadaceae bacterium]|nr:LPS assembly lipoprotein LptE [Dysgonamonadaceae bacterium]